MFPVRVMWQSLLLLSGSVRLLVARWFSPNRSAYGDVFWRIQLSTCGCVFQSWLGFGQIFSLHIYLRECSCFGLWLTQLGLNTKLFEGLGKPVSMTCSRLTMACYCAIGIGFLYNNAKKKTNEIQYWIVNGGIAAFAYRWMLTWLMQWGSSLLVCDMYNHSTPESFMLLPSGVPSLLHPPFLLK